MRSSSESPDVAAYFLATDTTSLRLALTNCSAATSPSATFRSRSDRSSSLSCEPRRASVAAASRPASTAVPSRVSSGFESRA